jgi:integrase
VVVTSVVTSVSSSGTRATVEFWLNQDLRHTHATLLLRVGVPVKVVSERLGLANPALTLTVYQHVIPGMQEEAASLFSELIFGREEPATVPSP